MARLATCLVILRDQINARWPTRNKSSDGWIGDEAHQGRPSDHNPGADGVVEAIDVTHDPAGGFDSYAFAELLRRKRDRRIEYVISNGRIFYAGGAMPWQWQSYSGASPHTEHVHISCQPSALIYEDASPWDIESAPDRPGLHRGIVATFFGGPSDAMSGAQTAYGNLIAPNWWNRPGVALPARINDRPLPAVKVTYNGKSIICPVIDVGPWNTKDPYWVSGARPQAESGFDMTGRKTNLAGIDLTPAAADAIGLPGKGLVDWEFVKENDMPDPANPADPLAQILAAVNTLNANFEMLMRQLGTVMPPAPTPQPKPQPVPVPVPAPAPAPSTPVLQQPGVGIGILGALLSGILNVSGVTGPMTGDAATTTGQLLPLISAGVAALGATGMFGTWGSAISTVLSALTQPKPKT